MPESYWSTVTQVEPNLGQTKKGKPLRRVATTTGKDLQLLGTYDLLMKIGPGAEIQHSAPSEFNGKWYATLELIEPPTKKQAVNPPEPKILGELKLPAAPASAVPTWEEYKRVAYAAQDLAMQLESDIPCDPKTNDQYINNSMARAAIVQSILVAFRDGKVQAPTEKDHPENAPMQKDEGFPWERAS